jgi:hypothetical protein
MVARNQRKQWGRASRTPSPLQFDSDVLTLALVTAQALEAEGDLDESARWLRRAARQAKRDGHTQRAALIARAARDLAPVDRLPSPSEPSAEDVAPSARKSFLRVTRPNKQRSARALPSTANAFALRSRNAELQRAGVWEAMLALFGVMG